MSGSELTEEQAYWLHRVLVSRPRDGLRDDFTIPAAIQEQLAVRGFIRRYRRAVEITLDGIREITGYHRARESRQAARDG